jgi:hypothetical protein
MMVLEFGWAEKDLLEKWEKNIESILFDNEVKGDLNRLCFETATKDEHTSTLSTDSITQLLEWKLKDNYNMFHDIILTPSGESVQIKFPRSKRKRIRKKWRKNLKNYAWTENKIYQFEGHLFIPRHLYEKMLKTLLKKELKSIGQPLAHIPVFGMYGNSFPWQYCAL